MELIPILLKEMEQESATTRKMLSIVPDERYNWKPHEKSMSIQQLTAHIAELPTWVSMILTTNELDFAANPYKPVVITNTKDLLAYFEKCLADGKKHLLKVKEEDLLPMWALRNGNITYSIHPKHEAIRASYCQIVHHRAQLGVYLRLLNIPIPGSYGPSADEGF